MKQIFVAIMALMMFATTSTFAQSVKTAKTKTEAAVVDGKHVKKDGTLDKRYKENKDAAAKETKHLKKDGTADKRFKENKTQAAKTVKKAA